jgi:3-isopropylmalate dehydratase small subunit
MQKFDQLTGVAAPLPMMNVDTDMIIPKQFLKTIKRSGLGKNLFDAGALTFIVVGPADQIQLPGAEVVKAPAQN